MNSLPSSSRFNLLRSLSKMLGDINNTISIRLLHFCSNKNMRNKIAKEREMDMKENEDRGRMKWVILRNVQFQEKRPTAIDSVLWTFDNSHPFEQIIAFRPGPTSLNCVAFEILQLNKTLKDSRKRLMQKSGGSFHQHYLNFFRLMTTSWPWPQ